MEKVILTLDLFPWKEKSQANFQPVRFEVGKPITKQGDAG